MGEHLLFTQGFSNKWDNIKDKMISADILNDIYGSDHCPVTLEIK